MYIREDMADIRVTVNDRPYGDSWAEAEGGNLTADDSKTRPGGMGREVSAGGPASRDDVTVRIQMSDIVATWVPGLEDAVGNGRGKVAFMWLRPDRALLGSTLTRVGTVKAVNVPNVSSSSSTVGMLELVISCDELRA